MYVVFAIVQCQCNETLFGMYVCILSDRISITFGIISFLFLSIETLQDVSVGHMYATVLRTFELFYKFPLSLSKYHNVLFSSEVCIRKVGCFPSISVVSIILNIHCDFLQFVCLPLYVPSCIFIVM